MTWMTKEKYYREKREARGDFSSRLVTRRCPVCGVKFRTARAFGGGWRRYCSNRCRQQAYRDRLADGQRKRVLTVSQLESVVRQTKGTRGWRRDRDILRYLRWEQLRRRFGLGRRCEQCGELLSLDTSLTPRRRFCSAACRSKHWREQKK